MKIHNCIVSAYPTNKNGLFLLHVMGQNDNRFIILLNDNGTSNVAPNEILTVNRPCSIRFVLSGCSKLVSCDGVAPTLFTNYVTSKEKFNVNKFTRAEWTKRTETSLGVEGDWIFDIENVDRSGPFKYFLLQTTLLTDDFIANGITFEQLKNISNISNCTEEDNLLKHSKTSITRIRHFIVSPKLVNNFIKDGKKELHTSAISCQTVLSKNIGDLSKWKPLMANIAQQGYNMVHFSPVQSLGISNSCYSLYHAHILTDQLLSKETHQQRKIQSARYPNSPNEQEELLKQQNLQDILTYAKKEHNIFAITDIVLNHTAVNSPWLKEHPEAGYTTDNCPHLKVAYELDQALIKYSTILEERDVSLSSAEDVQAAVRTFERDVLVPLRLWEYFVIDVDVAVKEFKEALQSKRKESFQIDVNSFVSSKESNFTSAATAKVNSAISNAAQVQHMQQTRQLQRKQNEASNERNLQAYDESHMFDEFSVSTQDFLLTKTNSESMSAPSLQSNAREDLISTCIYSDNSGDRFSVKIDLKSVLKLFSPNEGVIPSTNLSESDINGRCSLYRRSLERYNLPLFQQYDKDIKIILDNVQNAALFLHASSHGPKYHKITKETPFVHSYFTHLKNSKGKEVAVANSGWIWGADARVDFASSNSKAYFYRQLIVWSDSVKLRYGNCKADNPFLWDYMERYVSQMAKLFDGFRLDNCHTTPIHVAEHLLAIARNINPELYILAELFTGNGSVDAMFSSRLGLSSLVREAMSAEQVVDVGNQTYHSGSFPVHAFTVAPPLHLTPAPVSAVASKGGKSGCNIIFYDCTHDNEVPNQKRTAIDTLPNSAIVSMSLCAIGSSRGYDEIIPEKVDVVNEQKRYSDSHDVGIQPARAVLNKVHATLAEEGYSEIHVDHIAVTPQGSSKEHNNLHVTAIVRHNPVTNESVHLVCQSAFNHVDKGSCANVHIPFAIDDIVSIDCYARLFVPSQHFRKDPELITGLSSTLYLRTNEDLSSKNIDTMLNLDTDNNELVLKDFTPGTVIIFKSKLQSKYKDTLGSLKEIFNNKEELADIFKSLSLKDLNYLLFRCEAEEQATIGRGTYDFPNFKKLFYCGIHSLEHSLQQLRATAPDKQLGHPICNNLRAGNWLLEYTTDRLAPYSSLDPVRVWLENAFFLVKQLPRHVIPTQFDKVIHTIYEAALERTFSLMSPFINDIFTVNSRQQEEDTTYSLISKLALSSVALYGAVPGATINYEQQFWQSAPSLSAGLPHFSSGYMRNWGRDTFIALRGLLLVTGRFAEARSLIVEFASCLRHGLIPNLLNEGKNPRYNARDATWWFLQAIQDYCNFSGSLELLSASVSRHFSPEDTQYEFDDNNRHCKLYDIIQEIFQKHYNGIFFTEWNAGPNLDSKMQQRGFEVQIYFDDISGFIYGGNQYNCGTWMDKMGEAPNSSIWGVPATARNGAAVEIIGLLKSSLRWLSAISSANSPHFPFTFVTNKKTKKQFTYKEWDSLVQNSFERLFYVPIEEKNDFEFAIDKKIVNRRGIYKDTEGAFHGWADYQFRPNFLVAMVVAPELFDKKKAKYVLQLTEQQLVGPLGIKTLDPADWRYRGDYSNDPNPDDLSLSHGFNYHQGPEWVWLFGYYLRAQVMFSEDETNAKLSCKFWKTLNAHSKAIAEEYCGLPELTNSNGKCCNFSCRSQAWSSATILDAIHFLYTQRTKK